MLQRMTEPTKGLHQNPHTTYSALVLTDRSRLHQIPIKHIRQGLN